MDAHRRDGRGLRRRLFVARNGIELRVLADGGGVVGNRRQLVDGGFGAFGQIVSFVHEIGGVERICGADDGLAVVWQGGVSFVGVWIASGRGGGGFVDSI